MTYAFEKLIAEGVKGLVPYVAGKPMSELEREYGVKDIVKLASNENPLGPGEAAMQAVTNGVGDLGFYPDGNGFELKAKLSEHHNVEPDAITLGNGSNDVLVMLAETLLTPRDEAVFSQYSFAVYYLATQATGARSVIVPALDGNHSTPLGHDLEAMVAAVSERTKLVFVANPNNPTGTWLDGESLKSFVGSIPSHVIVVIDQAYVEYADDPAYEDAVPWIQDFRNLVVTHTFSKIHGLAGIRSGYSVSHPELASLLNRVRQPFNMNSLAQDASIAALGDNAHVERSKDVNKQGLLALQECCDHLGLPYIPSMCNFLLVDFGKPAEPVYEALLRQGIIVRPVGNYGLPNHLRISTGTLEQNQRLISALEAVIKTND